MNNRNSHLRASSTQFRTLQRYPRHPGVWRSLGVRLGKATRVVVGSTSVQIVRPRGPNR